MLLSQLCISILVYVALYFIVKGNNRVEIIEKLKLHKYHGNNIEILD